MKKMGDLYPRLRELPGHEAAAEADARVYFPANGPPAPAEFPPPAAQLASFARAMRRLVADGGRLAPRAVRKARRAACGSCSHHVASPDSCSKCGCGSVVPGGLVAKLAIASSECPDDPPRWGPV